MEKAIDIEYLANLYGVNMNSVAATLYPDNEYPRAALKRTINETGGNLRATQIIDLAKLLGCTPGSLFTINGGWHMGTSEGVHVLSRGDVRVTLDMESGVSVIRREGYGDLEVNMHTRQVSLTDYLDSIENIIAEHMPAEEE